MPFDLSKLTAKQLAECIHGRVEIAEKFLPFVKEILPKFGIDTLVRVSAFLSQTGHESAGFSALKENLNYSADGLANTWPNRYARKLQNGSYAKNDKGRYLPNDLALKLHRKPVDIANNCYANRMGNGDEASGDGWKYSGKGILQVTGKANYAQLTLETGIDFVGQPQLLEEPLYAILSACVFWEVNKLNTIADKEDIQLLSKKINGGTIGIQARLDLYKKAKAVLSSM